MSFDQRVSVVIDIIILILYVATLKGSLENVISVLRDFPFLIIVAAPILRNSKIPPSLRNGWSGWIFRRRLVAPSLIKILSSHFYPVGFRFLRGGGPFLCIEDRWRHLLLVF